MALSTPAASQYPGGMDQPQSATASSRPCQLYTYHSPVPSRTEGHHRFPVFLQNRVFGLIEVPELLWVCGTCHDNIHEWLGWLLGESRRPSPEPGRKAKAEAQRSFDLYTQALVKKGQEEQAAAQ